MIERISPDRAVAVVVGIEQYGLGERWNLDGVANDALEFTQWLVDRGVKKIKLYLSPLEKNRAQCDQFCAMNGISYLPATQEHVLRGLSHDLNSDPNLSGELLYLFWSGHGVASSDRVRYLLFSDAEDDHKTAVDFNSLLEMLRDGNRRLFPYQIGLVDACANYLGEKEKRLSLAGASTSGEGSSAKVKQFVMFASSIGERAEHDKERQTSIFSAEAIRRLKEFRPDAESYWPNITRLRNDLIAHFKKLKGENRLRFNQTPACLRWQWPDEDDGIVGAEIYAESILRYEQARRVYDKLRNLKDSNTRAFDEAYALTLHPRARTRRTAQGLEEQIESLAHLHPRKKGELSPLFEFVIRLRRYSEELIDLVTEELEKAKLPLAQLNTALEKIDSDPDPVLNHARKVRYLLFDLGLEQIECWDFLGDHFERHHWLEKSEDAHAIQISNYLNQLESDRNNHETLFLEFFVKFDELDDQQDFDQWEHSLSTLGSFYPLGVRWRDRTFGQRKVKQNFWVEKTQAIKERAVLDQSPPIFWLPDANYKPARLMPYLTRTHDHDCFGFTSSPVGRDVSDELRKTLQSVLLGGAPYAFWPRREPNDQQNFKARFEHEISTNCHCVDHLPNRVKILREESACQEDHFCASVTLLWDDPDRNPLNCDDDQLGMPE